MIPADKTFEFWCVNSLQHWLSLHVFKSDKLYRYHGMINFGFFNDVLHDLWAGNVLGWRTHQGGVGRGICSRLTEDQRATRRFFIPISPRFEYYMNVVENFWYFKPKKCKLSKWGGAQQRGKVMRVLTATTMRTPIVGVFNEWK